MIYDILCLLMVLLAFIGGFQKGVVKIFGLLMAIIFACIILLWSAPYLNDFLIASMTTVPNWLGSTILVTEFIVVFVLFWSLLRSAGQTNTKVQNSIWQNTLGGLFLSAFMLLSISILSGFFEQTNVIQENTKQKSIAYQFLSPVQQKSKLLWRRLTTLKSESRPAKKVKAASIDG